MHRANAWLGLGAVLIAAASCSIPGGPHYARGAPSPLPFASQRADHVTLFVTRPTGIEFGTWAGTGGHNNFRIDFDGKSLGKEVRMEPPADPRVVGDVRSADAAFDEADYVKLECGWGFLEHTSAGSIREPCASRNPNSDRDAVADRITNSLREVASAAASAGANAVINVRCFGVTEPIRLFCEGTAASVFP